MRAVNAATGQVLSIRRRRTTVKSVAYVTNNKKTLFDVFVLLKLTTDSHEASRGLFATAELLVLI